MSGPEVSILTDAHALLSIEVGRHIREVASTGLDTLKASTAGGLPSSTRHGISILSFNSVLMWLDQCPTEALDLRQWRQGLRCRDTLVDRTRIVLILAAVLHFAALGVRHGNVCRVFRVHGAFVDRVRTAARAFWRCLQAVVVRAIVACAS